MDLKNSGVEDRQMKDKILKKSEEDEELDKKAYLIMQRKAKLYDELSRH